MSTHFDVVGRPALINVDMQNYFLDDSFKPGQSAAAGIIPNINALSQAVRAADGLVVHVVTDGSERASGGWPSYKRVYGEDGWRRRLAGLSADTWGFKLHKDIAVSPGDLIHVKTRFSAFLKTSTDLDALLRREGIGTLIVTGTRTEVCCESTIRDAMMLDWTVVAVDDAMSTLEPDVHAASMRAMCPRFATGLATSDVIAALKRVKAAA